MDTTLRLEGLTWPLDRLAEALPLLVRASGLIRGSAEVAVQLPPSVLRGPVDELDRWLTWAGERLGVEAESVDSPLPQFEQVLRRGGPAVIHLHHPRLGRRCVLLMAPGRGGSLRVLGSDGRPRRCEVELLRGAICAPHEAPLQPGITQLLDAANVPASRRDAVRRLMLDQRLATQPVAGCWLLRLGATAPFAAQLRQARLPHRLGTVLLLFAAIYALEISGWRLIGDAALDGRLDTGWLAAWVLLVMALVPLRALSGWLDGTFALGVGLLLKQRLLAGALRLDLQVVRRLGAGQLLGRVMESQALEGLALSGGVAVIVATLELGFAAWVLGQGAAAALHLLLLAAWLALTVGFSLRYGRTLQAWTQQRLDMTHELVERMVGHRTALAQERPERRMAHDDATLGRYLQTSRELDGRVAPIVALAPGGWIVLGLAALAPALAHTGTGSDATTSAALAISLGGILFAHRALGGISAGLSSLMRAALAWRRVGEIFDAARADPAAMPYLPKPVAQQAAGPTDAPLLQAQGLAYDYGNGAAPVLRGASLQIADGERVLLQGASGGGKSTLAALLVGLRQPTQGLLLLGGLDRATLGEQWHTLATESPQFHENHVLTGTLAFNLLMGRNWPASDAERDEALALCEELGLGPLLQRMPAGLQQRIGETGWQLSHGERSRLFLARALLQKAPLTVLDESFAALDPATLQLCMQAVLRHTRSLVVIAHP